MDSCSRHVGEFLNEACTTVGRFLGKRQDPCNSPHSDTSWDTPVVNKYVSSRGYVCASACFAAPAAGALICPTPELQLASLAFSLGNMFRALATQLPYPITNLTAPFKKNLEDVITCLKDGTKHPIPEIDKRIQAIRQAIINQLPGETPGPILPHPNGGSLPGHRLAEPHYYYKPPCGGYGLYDLSALAASIFACTAAYPWAGFSGAIGTALQAGISYGDAQEAFQKQCKKICRLLDGLCIKIQNREIDLNQPLEPGADTASRIRTALRNAHEVCGQQPIRSTGTAPDDNLRAESELESNSDTDSYLELGTVTPAVVNAQPTLIDGPAVVRIME